MKTREALTFLLLSALLLTQPWTGSAGVVYGTIADKDGQPLPKVKVVAYDYDFNDLTKGDPRASGDCEEAVWILGAICPGDEPDKIGEAITDANGNYRIDYGLPGKWPEAPANWDRSSGWPGDNRWRPDIFIEAYIPTEGFCEPTRNGGYNWRLGGYSAIVVDNPPEIDCPISLAVNESFDLTCGTFTPLTPYMSSTSGELRGWVDMHAHPMSHLGLGGKMIHGTPDVGALMHSGTRSCDILSPTRADGLSDVLTHCGPTHMWWEPGFRECGDILRYALVKVLEKENEAASRHGPGFPKFPPPGGSGVDGNGWRPHWSDITHQKMWIDWVYRAYRGGQRGMVALALHSRTLALVSNGPDLSYDQAAGDLQIAEIKEMVKRHGFMEIAYSPAQFRDIVGRNKLAIVLGLELDDLGDFTRNSSSEDAIRTEIDRLHTQGVRYVFPVHLTDNRLAGSAVYNELFNVATFIQTGQYWQLATATNISFRFPNLRSEYTNLVSSINTIMSLIPLSETVTGPALGDLSEADRQDPKKVLEAYLHYILGDVFGQRLILPDSSPECPTGHGHVNAKGLTSWGATAINHMMSRGMMIDTDHMSKLAFDDALALTQVSGYALNSGHNGCSTTEVLANENNRTAQQYSMLTARGGMLGVGLGTNADDFISAYTNAVAAAAKGDPSNVRLGLGTDMNGMYHGPQPPTGAVKALDYSQLPRGKTGLATWDYNLDGVAHYGMLPDFLVHVGQRPGGSTVLTNIFGSAEGFARMWEKCLASGVPAPVIVVEHPTGTKLSNGGTEINCGLAELGAASIVRTFTVRNTGTASLTGLALSKDGANPADFTLGALGASELAPGASTTFNVTFKPTAAGQRRAVIQLASNDADQNPFEILLLGEGVLATTITTENPLPLGTVGSSYRLPFGAGGGTPPWTWTLSAGALPPGLTLGVDGVLSGTPTAAASARFTVRVDSAGNSSSASREFDLRILDASSPGALDAGFGNSGNAITPLDGGSARGYSVAVQNDGKIVVAGSCDTGAKLEFALARYSASGELDPAFGTLGVVKTDFGVGKSEAYSVALQRDGKIVAAGYLWNGFNYFLAVARYQTDGTLDTSFGGDGMVSSAVGTQTDVGQCVLVQADGRIVVGGRSYNGTKNDFALVRYQSDGRLDASFGSGGKLTTSLGSYDDEIRGVAIQADGKIVVAGSSRKASGDDIAVARYHGNGTLDTEFGVGGKVVTSVGSLRDSGQGLVLQSDGKIVVGGFTFNGSDTDFALLRYRADGTLDTAFGNDGRVVTPIGKYGDFGLGLALQSDDRIVLAGYSVGNGNYDFALVRYLADGKLDPTFGNGGKLATMVGKGNDVGTCVSMQADGKIVVAGYSEDTSGRAGFALVRYLGTTEPEIAVEQPEGNNLVDGSGSVGFGNRPVPGEASARQFTVRNASSATLTGLAVSKDGINAGDFTLGALGATTLAPGASTTFTVTFTPGALGQRSALLHIVSNDADENPFDLVLTAKGVLPPQITTTTPLPSGMTGVPYSLNFAASGGTEPYTWSVSSGALPAGLSLSSLGTLSGTPTVAGDATFSVRVLTDEALEAVKEFAVTIQELITWTNVAGGDWMDKANWSPNKVPTAKSVVLITRPGTYTVTLDYNAECQSLLLGGAPGTQSLDWKYGGFTGSMVVETNAIVNLAGSSLTLDGTVENRGRILWPAGQQVTWRFLDSSSLMNRPAGLLDLQGHGSFYGGAALTAAFLNEGTVRKSFDAGQIIVYSAIGLTNAGLMEVQTGMLELQGLESSNIVTVASGAVVEMTKGTFNFLPGHRFGGTGTWWVHGFPTINGVLDGNVLFAVEGDPQLNADLAGTMWWTNGTWSGNLTVEKSGLLNFESMKILGVMTNYGQLKWTGRPGTWYWEEKGRLENMAEGLVEVTFDRDLYVPPGASFNNYGTILKSGGTNQSSFRGQYAYTNYGLIDVRVGQLEFLHGLTSSGTIHVARGATVEFHGYDVNLGPNHKFTGEGTCAFGASTLHINGPLDGTVTLLMDYGTVFDATLNAPMIWKYGNPSGNLTVGPRGVLTMLAPGDFAGNLTNYGSVLWQSPQATSWRWSANARFYNASGGLFDMQGDHRFYGSFTNMVFENAGLFRKSQGTATAVFDSGFAFTNSGTLEVQSGKIWFRNPYSQMASGSISVSIGGVTPITQYSQVQFDKPPVFAGRFLASTSGGFRPSAGASFTVLSYPSAMGGFSPLNSIDLGSGLSLTPKVLPASLVLTAVQGVTLPSLVVTGLPGKLRIAWPDGYSGWRLFSATNIANPVWELVPLTPGTSVDLPTLKSQEFFRLQEP